MSLTQAAEAGIRCGLSQAISAYFQGRPFDEAFGAPALQRNATITFANSKGKEPPKTPTPETPQRIQMMMDTAVRDFVVGSMRGLACDKQGKAVNFCANYLTDDGNAVGVLAIHVDEETLADDHEKPEFIATVRDADGHEFSVKCETLVRADGFGFGDEMIDGQRSGCV
ncbi:MAG: hypothetical protein KDA21_01455 [Phycisphaerales bacterium]|nr:hypothetical protein [Phycisphaerales bacterium]